MSASGIESSGDISTKVSKLYDDDDSNDIMFEKDSKSELELSKEVSKTECDIERIDDDSDIEILI